MTRFQMEIKGLFGATFQASAEKEAQKAAAMVKKHAIVEEDGAVRWKESGHYLMDDLCEKLEYVGYPFSREATEKKRNEQYAEKISFYRKHHSPLTEEQLAEARNVFGEGTVIVDTITGEQYTV